MTEVEQAQREAENIQRAQWAKYELTLTGEAFKKLRERYVAQALGAKNPQEAYDAVLAVRALDSVVASLNSVITTAELDQKAKELKANQ